MAVCAGARRPTSSPFPPPSPSTLCQSARDTTSTTPTTSMTPTTGPRPASGRRGAARPVRPRRREQAADLAGVGVEPGRHGEQLVGRLVGERAVGRRGSHLVEHDVADRRRATAPRVRRPAGSPAQMVDERSACHVRTRRPRTSSTRAPLGRPRTTRPERRSPSRRRCRSSAARERLGLAAGEDGGRVAALVVEPSRLGQQRADQDSGRPPKPATITSARSAPDASASCTAASTASTSWPASPLGSGPTSACTASGRRRRA